MFNLILHRRTLVKPNSELLRIGLASADLGLFHRIFLDFSGMISFALQYLLPRMCGSLNLLFGDKRHLNGQMGNPMGYFSGKLEIMERNLQTRT